MKKRKYHEYHEKTSKIPREVNKTKMYVINILVVVMSFKISWTISWPNIP